VKFAWRFWLLAVFLLSGPSLGWAQIDPASRDLLQVGYNAALQGHPPLSAYAFFYHNDPGFLRTNLTLRLAIAPTYLDSELGIAGALGEHTDLGLGLAGGGYADNYTEIRQGKFLPKESFIGYGGEFNSSVYHLFNPGSLIPLNGILRAGLRYSTYDADRDTDDAFEVPDNRTAFSVRTGLRWGGSEPVLFPQLAMGISIWYDGEFRFHPDTYGYNYDRQVEAVSHLFWAEALLDYTLPDSGQAFDIRLTLGTSVGADRFSAYRLGALLPLVSEFPLSIPGYYYQELSAEKFFLLTGDYLLPLDKARRWNLNITAATAYVDYLQGFEQPGGWNSGVGAGILYRTPSLLVMVGYAYGFNAVRSDGPGAHSIGVLLQLNWGKAREEMFSPTTPNLWRGVQRVFGLFGG
jgi:hypothetical protein